jgi:hypothetical protein
VQDLPKIQLTADEAGAGVPLIDLYVKLGFASSKSEARKLMQVLSLSTLHTIGCFLEKNTCFGTCAHTIMIRSPSLVFASLQL